MSKTDMSDVDSSADMYERELGEREWLVDQCPIDLYCMSKFPRWGYPNKLMSYWETSPAVEDSCESLIIDSGFKKYGDMDEIFDEAKRYDPEWIIPPDITPHFHCYDEVSPESRAKELARHLRKWEQKKTRAKMEITSEVLLPLHRPVEGCLAELANPEHTAKWSQFGDGESLLDRYGGVAVGLKGLPSDERIEILGAVNRETPAGTRVHGLSPGTDMEMIAFLRENPHMMDSLDVSTPESAAKNNKIPDSDWKQHSVPFPRGTDVTTLRSVRALEIALRLNYVLSQLCNDSEFAEVRQQTRQATVGAVVGGDD